MLAKDGKLHAYIIVTKSKINPRRYTGDFRKALFDGDVITRILSLLKQPKIVASNEELMRVLTIMSKLGSPNSSISPNDQPT